MKINIARLGKALVICVPIAGVAVALAYGLAQLSGAPVTAASLFSSAMVPILLGVPLIWFLDWQSHRLRGAVLTLTQMRQEAENLAKRDSMTGLYNHQHFMAQIHNNTKRDDGSLIILDVDHFKSINDTYGDTLGDEALIQVVEAVRKSVRRRDMVGRIGGEEFAVFLQDATRAEAKLIASRIRQSVERIDFVPVAGVREKLTVSVGMAMKSELDNVVGAMQLADRRKIKARESGRNRVVDSGMEADIFDIGADTA